MRKLILSSTVSLDGYYEGPDREIDWHTVDEEVHTHFNEQFGAMSAFLEGRVTYELMEQFWPTADADPDAPAPIVEFARIWRRTPKIVYSRTLEKAGANAQLRREVDPEEIRRLKAESSGDLAVSGAQLGGAMLRHGLVDEYRVYVAPVLIGRGRPLFPPGTPKIELQLLETRTFGNGLVLLRYAPRPAVSNPLPG
jgi:dihydrofolate reductase